MDIGRWYNIAMKWNWKEDYSTIDEFKTSVEKRLDNHLGFAQLYVDVINNGFSIDDIPISRHPRLATMEEWEQLLIYHGVDFLHLQKLAEELGVKEVKFLWQKLKECDKLMSRVMPDLYRVFLESCDERRQRMAAGYYEKCRPEWTLPPGFDPENPFPDIIYPEGILD